MPIRNYLLNPIRELARQGKLAGILLILATILSMLLSNSDRGAGYMHLWETEIGFDFFNKSLLHWINDGLMVIFFLLVGLEIKRELVRGELSSVKQAILPAGAALGGVVLPALIYLLVHSGNATTVHGWAIPTATDIAFSLGILSLLGKRVPLSLKIFLTALAIIDDLAAILIIAIFYSTSLHLGMLLAGLGVFVLMLGFNFSGLKNPAWYLLPGAVLWFLILKSGIHPTIAGVLTAFAIPLDPGEELEHSLSRPVNYAILPLFALANTAIPLTFTDFSVFLTPVSIGILAGLFLGKPLGIVLFSVAMKALKIAEWPGRVRLQQMIGVGFTAGIGFTMSIFIASLSFTETETVNIAKLAIIGGSLLAAVTGMLILRFCPACEEKDL
jgi:NhaA family Na+:H+ antiporter